MYCDLCTKELKYNETRVYTNLKKHIEVAQREAYEAYSNAVENGNQVDLNEFKYSKQSLCAYSWLQITIMCLLPFSFVTNFVMHKYMKHGNESRFEFMTHLQKLTEIVESKITDALRDGVVFVSDRWAEHVTLYLTIFGDVSKGRFQTRVRQGSSWVCYAL